MTLCIFILKPDKCFDTIYKLPSFTYIATIFLVQLTGFKLNYEEYDNFPNNFAQPQTTLRVPLAEKHWSGLAKHYLYRFIQGVPGGMDKTSGECSLC